MKVKKSPPTWKNRERERGRKSESGFIYKANPRDERDKGKEK